MRCSLSTLCRHEKKGAISMQRPDMNGFSSENVYVHVHGPILYLFGNMGNFLLFPSFYSSHDAHTEETRHISQLTLGNTPKHNCLKRA